MLPLHLHICYMLLAGSQVEMQVVQQGQGVFEMLERMMGCISWHFLWASGCFELFCPIRSHEMYRNYTWLYGISDFCDWNLKLLHFLCQNHFRGGSMRPSFRTYSRHRALQSVGFLVNRVFLRVKKRVPHSETHPTQKDCYGVIMGYLR